MNSIGCMGDVSGHLKIILSLSSSSEELEIVVVGNNAVSIYNRWL